MSYAKLMQIIQNSKFIIIKTNPIQTSPFTSYIGYKAHKYHKSTKKSHSHFVISNNIFIFAVNFKSNEVFYNTNLIHGTSFEQKR